MFVKCGNPQVIYKNVFSNCILLSAKVSITNYDVSTEMIP